MPCSVHFDKWEGYLNYRWSVSRGLDYLIYACILCGRLLSVISNAFVQLVQFSCQQSDAIKTLYSQVEVCSTYTAHFSSYKVW